MDAMNERLNGTAQMISATMKVQLEEHLDKEIDRVKQEAAERIDMICHNFKKNVMEGINIEFHKDHIRDTNILGFRVELNNQLLEDAKRGQV